MNESLLRVRDLTVRFHGRRGTVHAVNGVSFDLDRGRSLGIVGESGCGKSQTCVALMGLLPQSAACSGSVEFEAEQLLALELHGTRASRAGGLTSCGANAWAWFSRTR
jgi:ABC-type glutathione transport system ATPase component